MTEQVDFFLRVARKKLGLGDDWRWFKLEAVGNTRDTIVSFGIPRLIRRDIRKGIITFRGSPTHKCVVTRDEVKSEELLFERETGSCSQCQGTMKVMASWQSDDGFAYIDCPRCGAIGVAPDSKTGRSP